METKKQKEVFVEEDRKEKKGMFDILNPAYSVDELDVRQNSEGVTYVQDSQGTTVRVSQELEGLDVEEVQAEDVEFHSLDEIEDVFGNQVRAE
jgi:hypothetical protein